MKYFSMFSGIGGFEYGIEEGYNNNQHESQKSKQANCQTRRVRDIDKQENCLCTTNNPPLCIGYSEIDKYAIATYKHHFPTHKNYGDAANINWSEVPDFGVLVGGFPCQSFSIAGKRQGFEDTRGTLFFEVCRAIKSKRPPLCILENVKGLLSHDEGRTFSTILTNLSELGYWWEYQVLNSKHFGVPQNRERVFIIGHLRGESGQQIFPLKESNGLGYRAKGTIKMIQNSGKEIARIYDSDGISPTIKGKSGGWQEPKVMVSNMSHREFGFKEICPTILGRDYKDPKVVAVLTPDRANKRQDGRRFKEDGEDMFTLTGQDKHGIMKDDKIRRLTPVECERLQGFPDNWTLGSDTQRYKQCGNAVTTNVIEAIFSKINQNTILKGE